MKRTQETLVVRSGLNVDQQHGSVVPPIYLSTTYNFLDFNQPRKHDYGRRSNPGRDEVQQVLAALEAGHAAVLTGSGMAAIHLICTVLLTPDDLLVAPKDCYGGSYRLFDSQQKRGAYKVLFIDQHDPQQLSTALALKPKVILIESPSNPLLRIVDIVSIAQQAHNVGTIVIADNTFLSPYVQQPLLLGADVVVHSCTKYLNGHSDVIAGVVITKHADLADEFAWWANNIGVTAAPFDSYLLLRGLRTLPLRMVQAQQNALDIVNFLKQQPKIKKLYHPSLPEHPGHEIAKKQQRGFGAMISFELGGGETEIRQFISALSLFTLAESLGGVESLISHTATMTHAAMSKEARHAAGISDSLLRISVGIEDSKDLIADLAHALQLIA